jgi:iron complex outermembrane recepter protein
METGSRSSEEIAQIMLAFSFEPGGLFGKVRVAIVPRIAFPFLAISLLSIHQGNAQTATASPTPSRPSASEYDANGSPLPDVSEVDRVMVTGSNIGGSQSPDWVPESIYNREAIERSGSRTLGDFLQQLPQNSGPTFTENQSDSLAGGASAIALRGLSPDATLVLVNGRRVAPYPFAQSGITAFVD